MAFTPLRPEHLGDPVWALALFLLSLDLQLKTDDYLSRLLIADI
jgi:hypothetical protein